MRRRTWKRRKGKEKEGNGPESEEKESVKKQTQKLVLTDKKDGRRRGKGGRLAAGGGQGGGRAGEGRSGGGRAKRRRVDGQEEAFKINTVTHEIFLPIRTTMGPRSRTRRKTTSLRRTGEEKDDDEPTGE